MNISFRFGMTILCFTSIALSKPHPSLKENEPYCIYWKNAKLKFGKSEGSQIQIVDGDGTVFKFGKWSDPNTTEYEAHYLFELDSGQTQNGFDSLKNNIPDLYFQSTAFHGGKTNKIENGKLSGVKASDSTWLVYEWISRDFESMFGTMPYRSKKRDKRMLSGYRRLCKEIKDPVPWYLRDVQ